jgi:hypothetical protein
VFALSSNHEAKGMALTCGRLQFEGELSVHDVQLLEQVTVLEAQSVVFAFQLDWAPRQCDVE